MRYYAKRVQNIDSGVEPADLPTTDRCGEQNADASSNAPDTESVGLFPPGTEGLSGAVVESPGGEQLVDEDLAFLTDDFIAQLNRTEAAANLDLVELALFAGGGPTAPDQSRPEPSTLPGEEVKDDGDDVVVVRGDGDSSDVTIMNEARHHVKTDPTTNAPPGSPEISATSVVNATMIVDPSELQCCLTRPLHVPESPTAALNITMTSAQVLAKVHGLGRSGGPWWPGIQPEGSPTPSAPPKPYPTPTRDKLLPATPCVHLSNRKDAYSPELMRYCLSQPVVVIRELAGTLRMDLSLFSTKTLHESNPEHRLEVSSIVGVISNLFFCMLGYECVHDVTVFSILKHLQTLLRSL